MMGFGNFLSLEQDGWMFALIRMGAWKSLKMTIFYIIAREGGENSRTQNNLFSLQNRPFFPLQSFFDKTEGRNKLLGFKIVDKWVPCYSPGTGLKTLDPNWRQHPISVFLSKIYLLWPQSPVQLFLSSHSQTNFVAPKLWNSSHVTCVTTCGHHSHVSTDMNAKNTNECITSQQTQI